MTGFGTVPTGSSAVKSKAAGLPTRALARVRRFVDKRRKQAVRFRHRLMLGWRRRSLPMPMTGRFLVTGPTGVGKSEVSVLLSAAGFHSVEADRAFGYHGNLQTGERTDYPDQVTHEWYESFGWLWPPKAVHELLADASRPLLFVCGGADNEAQFYSRFDRVFVLHATTATLLRRLARREPSDLTRHPVAIHRLRESNQRPPHLPRDARIVIVDAEVPIVEVVCAILREAACGGPE